MTNSTQQIMYPKPRYSVAECEVLLGISHDCFYRRVREGAYETIKDGRRTFMTHQQLEQAALGDEVAA